MRLQQSRSAGEGLERSCDRPGASWIDSAAPVDGVELFRAWFAGEAYDRHRHDTYAIGLTRSGVQMFDYRGATRTSMPGEVVVLYPDEVHDGRAGDPAGFGYRIVYVQPALLADVIRAVAGRPAPLPFVDDPVSTNPALARAIDAAFDTALEPLAADSLLADLASGLLAAARRDAGAPTSRRIDRRAVESARRFLDAERTRVVRSAELESITGLTRYELCRQFRVALGTSPHRYLVMRRLELAREHIHRGRPLVDVACDVGFADQAHFTRAFKSAFGLTPARYRALRRDRATTGSPEEGT
jgi:AraC-like DNA-binding protein